MKALVLMLKAIHSHECKEVDHEEATQVVKKLKAIKLEKVVKKVENVLKQP